jgi:hypothetical protein
MVIYQIRCNLAHGQKSPNRERDVQLCKAPLSLRVAFEGDSTSVQPTTQPTKYDVLYDFSELWQSPRLCKSL